MKSAASSALAASPRSDLSIALAGCRHAVIGLGVFSVAINLLQLTGPVFMLEVYDRVLPGRSIPTLIGISLLALILFGFQGVLDIVRGRVLVRIAASIDQKVSARVYDVATKLPLRAMTPRGYQPLHDLDRIRSFVSSTGAAALFDLPWMPFYLGVCFIFHPLIGLAATVGGLILVAITLVTEFLSRGPTREASSLADSRMALSDASRRNAEVVQAMGMGGRLAVLWESYNRRHLGAQLRVADITGGLGALSRLLRMILQSAVLGIGAYLVINQQASAGIIIASSILTSRALAPVEVVIANWRGFVGARQSWQRLKGLLTMMPVDPPRMELPAPRAALTLEAVSVRPPGTDRVVVENVAFQLKAGQGLGVIGLSASGKSSLGRAIVGVWPTARGNVRIDGAAIDQWSAEALGAHIGYLPQDMGLFDGTIAQNISRFDADASAASIITAAKAAGVHGLIVGLPDGYETRTGEGGANLSAGQRQRIGLARALYGDPFLVVLDEPNSNLDREGDEALTRTILGVRARGGIVVVIAHRPSALAGVDNVLVLQNGRPQALGPKEKLLAERPLPHGQMGQVTALRSAARAQKSAS